jgi:hypothetical protein
MKPLIIKSPINKEVNYLNEGGEIIMHALYMQRVKLEGKKNAK